MNWVSRARSTPPFLSGRRATRAAPGQGRTEEHTSELQSLMRISYAVFCLTKKTRNTASADAHHGDSPTTAIHHHVSNTGTTSVSTTSTPPQLLRHLLHD